VQGRADAAAFWLPRVVAPTLVIADASPCSERRIAEDTYDRLGGTKKLVRVATEGHCFSEPDAMAQVARHAQRWFVHHFVREPTRARSLEAGLRPAVV
jgi:hypothetical protein